MRHKVTKDTIEQVVETFKNKLQEQFNKKGKDCFASSHEILGVITEEYYELIEAIKKGDGDDIRNELYDVAISALFGLMSIETYSCEW